ncbi:NAD dependent epimerase/dehydratase [Jackrogersella minutella]|nr:NAD dependent epimerase/dehydratase [Jackrogersella minutella]
MTPSKIFVTAATGTQGGGVVRQCLQNGHTVYALARDPCSQAAKLLSDLGAKLVKGSFEDVASLRTGMQNADVVFLNLPAGASDLTYTTHVIKAAQSASVPWIICSTAVNTGQHESFPGWGPRHPMYHYWLGKDAIENLVRGSGLPRWTIVQPAHLLQNLLPPVDPYYFPGFAERKVLKSAYSPEAKLGWVDAADVGKVVATALSDPDRYSGKEIPLAAESLTIGELAEKVGKAIGKPVTTEFYTDSELAAMGPGLMTASQKWASEVPTGLSAESAAAEFGLTSVHDFFARNSEIWK